MSNVRVKAKKVKNAAGRLTVSIILIALQIGILVWLFYGVGGEIPGFHFIFNIIGFIFAIYLVGSGKHLNSTLRASYLILVILIPAFAIIFYLIRGKNLEMRILRNRYENVDAIMKSEVNRNDEDVDALRKINPSGACLSDYAFDYGKFPVFSGNAVEYYPEAIDGFKRQLEDIKNAKEFIFMEYFIVEDAPFMHELVDLLEQKVKEGVEVRFMYDDLGSAKVIGREFTREMNARGIQCRIYNPVSFLLTLFINNRDHRKITVIDGKIGYTGGYNLAEEYFGYITRFGHWKDTGIRIEGPAVDTLTTLFIEGWNYNYAHAIEVNPDRFLHKTAPSPKAVPNSFVQPFGDCPLGEERIGENIYMNLANRSTKYLYITTPYLIVTDEMVCALTLAAKRGVDVRIITPGIPDKKMVYSITRSYYKILLESGVKIYEYTPGFLHAKMFLSDDDVAVVGTVNMDFRSLYHHFENAVLLYNLPMLQQVREDFDQMFDVSKLYTEVHPSLGSRIKQCILRIFAPLL